MQIEIFNIRNKKKISLFEAEIHDLDADVGYFGTINLKSIFIIINNF